MINIDNKKMLESLAKFAPNKESLLWIKICIEYQGYKLNDNFEIVSIEPEQMIEAGKWYVCIKETVGYTIGKLYCSKDDGFLESDNGICSYHLSGNTLKECFRPATEEEISEVEYTRQDKGIENGLRESYKAMEEEEQYFKVGERVRIKGTNVKGDVITNVYESGGITMYEFENGYDAPQSINWELVEPKKSLNHLESNETLQNGELTEFEKELISIIGYGISLAAITPEMSIIEFAKGYSDKLLSIAEKEIRKKIVESIDAQKMQEEYYRDVLKGEVGMGDNAAAHNSISFRHGIEETLNKIKKG